LSTFAVMIPGPTTEKKISSPLQRACSQERAAAGGRGRAGRAALTG